MKQITINILVLFTVLCQTLYSQVTPIAKTDSLVTKTNIVLTIPAPGILQNDTYTSLDSINVVSFKIKNKTFNANETAKITEGSILINANGSLVFTPKTNYYGAVPIVNYTISNGQNTSKAPIVFTIQDAAPIAKNDSYKVKTNTELVVNSPGLLNNDTDTDGDVLELTTFSIDSTTYKAGKTATFKEGVITISSNGSFNFIPAKNYNGVIPTINYSVTDKKNTATAQLKLTIANAFRPTAKDTYDTADINTPLKVNTPGVLETANDRDNNHLTVSHFTIDGVIYKAGKTATFTQGSISVYKDGSYLFTPNKDYIGDVSRIIYTITDGKYTVSKSLYLTVEKTKDLLKINTFESCAQSYTKDGVYYIAYNMGIENTSTARDYHENSMVKNINIKNHLDAIFGKDCALGTELLSISTNAVKDYVGKPYPLEFDNSVLNEDFINAKSDYILNETITKDLTLYPRQSIQVFFYLKVSAFCNNRPNPTPSESVINFNSVVNVSSSKGSTSKNLLLKDFHTTEGNIASGLYIPNEKPNVNLDGTYTFKNSVVLKNKGTGIGNNINYNMGLANFIDNGVAFKSITITQVSGPKVTINRNYNGITDTFLLAENNSLETDAIVILDIVFHTEPYSAPLAHSFSQLNRSQTQGHLDGLNETDLKYKKYYSYVKWTDGLGKHVNKYQKLNSLKNLELPVLGNYCTDYYMILSFNSSNNITKTVTERLPEPNGILEHEQVTFNITIYNTSKFISLKELQIEDNLVGATNIVSMSKPKIIDAGNNSKPILNPKFNGVTDTSIFDGASGELLANNKIVVAYTVTFLENYKQVNTTTFTSVNPITSTIASKTSLKLNYFTDSDNDGVSNVIDLDDDNDTIPDIIEYAGQNPLADNDNDLVPNYRDTDFGKDTNNDGIVDIFDFDNDGVANHLDSDSDNDGIIDIIESGNTSGLRQSRNIALIRVGKNGLCNISENTDSFTTSTNYSILNTDKDNNPNFIDIDSDNDGIVDHIEAQATEYYIAPSKTVSEKGIDTAYLRGIIPVDTDRDKIFDFIDTNSDNDYLDDVIEGWVINTKNEVTKTPFNLDIDKDGLDDAFDNDTNTVNPTNSQTPNSFPNFDNTDNPERDWREDVALLVSINNAETLEGNKLNFTISLTRKINPTETAQSNLPIDIIINTKIITDKINTYKNAVAPYDYDALTNKKITIAANTSTTNFTINTKEDTIDELAEAFLVTGSVESSKNTNKTTEGVAKIIDNDNAPLVTIEDSRIEEGNDLAHVITLSNPSSRPLQIKVNTTDGSAISPDDYASIDETVIIPGTINQNAALLKTTVLIPTFLDNLNEKLEEIISIRTVINRENNTKEKLINKGVIVDVDPYPSLFIESATAVEGAPLEYNISLVDQNNNPVQNDFPIEIKLESIDGSANSLHDFKEQSTTLTIPAYTSSVTHSFNTIDDKENETTESMALSGSMFSEDKSKTISTRGVGYIKDNDYPNLFSPNSDGKSDEFKLLGIEDFPEFTITIVDRVGNTVFDYKNKGNQNPTWWDGTINGKPAPEGVYYYSLNYNDGKTKPKTNFIQLIR